MDDASVKRSAAAAFEVARDFDRAAYFQRLADVAMRVHRLHDARDPALVKQRFGMIDELFSLIAAGKRYAELALDKDERPKFRRRIMRIAAESGLTIAAAQVPKPDMATEFDFSDRLPRYVRERGASSPEWHLLQIATRKTRQGLLVIGFAQTGRETYSLFEGTEGDLYIAREVDLLTARNAMSRAFRAGFKEIPRRAL